MRGAGLTLLALVTLGAVVFALVELHAAKTPHDVPPAAAPPSASTSAPPVAPPAPDAPSTPIAAAPRATPVPPPAPRPAGAASPAPASGINFVQQKINGKTRREWHDYFEARRRAMQNDIERNQQVIDRALAGEEPDPRELGDAHVKVRELKKEMQQDQQQEQQIESTPAP